MMEQWIRSIFDISEGTWDDGTDEFVFTGQDGEQVSASISSFVSQFGPKQPMTLSDLKAKDLDNKSGWHRHFDAWVDKRIIAG